MYLKVVRPASCLMVDTKNFQCRIVDAIGNYDRCFRYYHFAGIWDTTGAAAFRIFGENKFNSIEYCDDDAPRGARIILCDVFAQIGEVGECLR